MFKRRMLFTLALVATGFIIVMGYSFFMKTEKSAFLPEDITIEEVAVKILSPEYTLIDVRTAKELESGYIKGAINIDVKSADFNEKISQLPRDKKYILYCVSGNRSSSAVKTMQSMGFSHIEHMREGMNGWNAKGLPVEK